MAAFSEPHFDAYQSANFGNVTVFDMVRPEMRHLVDPHWGQFPPMNPLWHSILGFAIFVLGIISMFGNYIVMSVFTSAKNLRTPSNLLVVNLALSDFLMMFTMGPPMVYNCMKQTWVLGPLWCQLYAMFGSLFGCVSIWTMTMIAFDRYNVIVKGLSARPMTKSQALTKIAIIWAVAAVWVSFPFFGWNRYVPEGKNSCDGDDWYLKCSILF